MYRLIIKRALDILLSVCALILLLPLILLVCLAIVIDDGWPVIFNQQRVGIHGKPFVIYKFRSMPVETPNTPSRNIHMISITRVGKVLRRLNIDELPQLVNILKGEMSIVGPRPALPSQVELLQLRVSCGAEAIRPGLTGLAQIYSFDGMIEAEKAKLDGEYASRVSLRLDTSILLRTIGYLFRSPPVY